MEPIAFRIRDFRSIADSGVCELSGDSITVLAGQNESGKTAVLTALRDFDTVAGKPPKTPEFLPEGNDEAQPSVSILFSVDPEELADSFDAAEIRSPGAFRAHLDKIDRIWITRDLLTNHFRFDPEVSALWDIEDPEDETDAASEGEDDYVPLASAEVHADGLYPNWPLFVYFDSFSDTLPRDVTVESLVTGKGVPQIVSDFLLLAGIDNKRLLALANNPKQLGNYLDRRSAAITGDFLTYWKQRIGSRSAVELRAISFRDEAGIQKLAFFVRDHVDQYPEQRSRGFLWFLSFFLRLAAAEKKSGTQQVVLVDEPGSYLHARAQRDILHLFEDRLARTQHVVYTTHSPYLLPPDKLHRVRLVIKEPSRGTLAGR